MSLIETLNSDRSLSERLVDSLVTRAELLAHVPRVFLNTKVDLSIIRGRIAGRDDPVRMLYVGRGTNRAYLRGKLLRDAEVESSVQTTLFSYRPIADRLGAEVDFTFVDIGMPYQDRIDRAGDYLVLPDWINMIIPLEGDWDSIESRFNKTTRKMIRRTPYRSELTRDPEVISRFYDDYYLPYLNLRHEDGVVEPRRAVERRARQGGILRVIGEDGPIVAGVVYPEDGVLYYLWLGMAERYLHDQPEGALAASYYFCLRHAHDQGFRAANWMGTRAFPTDGVYQFKRKWGPVAEDSFSPDSLLFRPSANNRNAVLFAETFPLLARRDGTLEQIHCTTSETLGEVEINRMLSAHACDGIDRFTIVQVLDTAARDTIRTAPSHSDVRIVTTDVAGFARYYRRHFTPPPA